MWKCVGSGFVDLGHQDSPGFSMDRCLELKAVPAVLWMPSGTSQGRRGCARMLTDQQLNLLRQVQDAVAFDDGREGMADQLVISGRL